MARTLSTSLPGPQSFVHDSSSEDIDDGKHMELASGVTEVESAGTRSRGDDVKKKAKLTPHQIKVIEEQLRKRPQDKGK